MNNLRFENKLKNSVYNFLIVLLFTLSTLFLVWKAQFGCSGGDEGMYLAIPYRILQGDTFFRDEWIFLQFGELFLLPILKVYLLLFKTTNGIFLYFRYIYILFKLFVSFLILNKFYKYKYFSLFAALLYYLYSVGNIMMLSYNTFGYSMIIVSFLIILPTDVVKNYQYFLSGIFFALACTCQVTILFFIIPIFLITFIIKKNYRKQISLFILGCFVTAIITLSYFHITTGLNNIFKYLPYCFIMDKLFHNSSRSIVYFILMNIRYYLAYNLWSIGFIFFYPLLFIYIIYIFNTYQYIKYTYMHYKNNLFKYAYYVVFILVTMLVIIYSLYHPNFILFPFVLFSIYIYEYLDDSEKKVLLLSFAFSMIEVFGFYSSENYGAVTSFAVMPLCIVNIVYLYKVCILEKKWLRRLALINIVAVFICLILSRTIRVYLDNSIFELNTKFDNSIFRGIYTTDYKYNLYSSYIDEINNLELTNDNSILFFNDANYSWMPLCTEARLCQYSPYLFSVEDNVVYLLSEYYKEFPSKYPEYVYITDTTNNTKEKNYDLLIDVIGIDNYSRLYNSEYSIILKRIK